MSDPSTHARDARAQMEPGRRALYDLWEDISARRRAARTALREASDDDRPAAQAAYDIVQREANDLRRYWVQIRYAAHGLDLDGLPTRLEEGQAE